MADLQEVVDGLVSAVVGRDVLFIIYWLEQLPRDHIDDEHSETSLSALQAAVADPTLSHIQRLSVQLLLLSGARPDYFGTKSSARLKAQEAGNFEALELLDSWAAAGREQATDAAMLLAMGSAAAEGWIVENGFESDAIGQERAEAVAAQQQQASAQEPAADWVMETAEADPPMPMDQPLHLVDHPDAKESSPLTSMSFGSPSPPPVDQTTAQVLDAPSSPSTKRKRHELEQSTAPVEPAAATPQAPPAAASNPMGTFFDVEDSEERRESIPAPRSVPAPTKKLRIDLPSQRLATAEAALPSFDSHSLFIQDINPRTEDNKLEVSLQERLPAGFTIHLTPRCFGVTSTSAQVEGSGVDLPSLATLLTGTVVDERSLRVTIAAPAGSTSRSRPPSSELDDRPTDRNVATIREQEDEQMVDDEPASSQRFAAVPPHLCQFYCVVRPGPIDDGAIQSLFSDALRECGQEDIKIKAMTPLPTSTLRERVLVGLEYPVQADALLAEMKGKVVEDQSVVVVRADQVDSTLSSLTDVALAPPLPLARPPAPSPIIIPRQPWPAPFLPSASFVVRNLAKNTTAEDLEQAFEPVFSLIPPNSKINAAVVSGKKGKVIGHVSLSADVDRDLVLELLRGKVIRGRLITVEVDKGQGAGASASTTPLLTPQPRDGPSNVPSLPTSTSPSSPVLCGQFHVENLGRKAQSTDVKAAFLRAVDHQLIKSINMADGGGSAIVTLSIRVDLEKLKTSMKDAEINGRRLVISPHEVGKEQTPKLPPIPTPDPTTSEPTVLPAIHYRPTSTAPVLGPPPRNTSSSASSSSNATPLEKRRFPLSSPPRQPRADTSQPASRPASRLSDDRGRSPVRSFSSGASRRLSPTSAAGVVFQKSVPHSKRRMQYELDQWASEAAFGRFPATYFPYPPPAVLAEASEASRGFLKTGWRTRMCSFWPPKVGMPICKGRTCWNAHSREELRRPDGSLVNPDPGSQSLPVSQPPPVLPPPPTVEAPRPKRRHDWGSSEEDDPTSAATSTSAMQVPTNRTSSSTTSTDPRGTTTSTSSAATSLSPSAHQRSLDDARLASLNYSPADIEALNTLMQPMDQPPSADFDRTAQLEVNFGYLSPEEARKALGRQGRKRAFGDDERKQVAYERFLEAQMGTSRDLYTVFFAQLTEFNDESRMFMQGAKQALAAARGGGGGR